MFKQLWATKHPHASHEAADGLGLQRALGPWGLTALGIGAVIGGGIFVITGQAAADHAGPAIMLSFVLAAVCCAFCAMAYAEFAAMVPVSGSAYTYTYATFGELAAWFIGWMLVLEYGVSASAVAVSWTGYFLSLLEHFDIHLPAAFVSAPLDGKLQPTGAIANLPAAGIVLLLTWLCYVGIRKSSAMNMAMAKDGLMPKLFGKVHPKFRTPYVGTLFVGVVAALLAGVIPLNVLGELVSMGTLLAFATVCAGVLVLRFTKPDLARPFRVPLAMVICPLGALACLFLFFQAFQEHWKVFVGWTVIGLAIYFGYGIHHSRLAKRA